MKISLSLVDYASLSPLLTLLAGSLIILLVESFLPKISKKISFLLTVITLLLAIVAEYLAPNFRSPLLGEWLIFDKTAHIFSYLFLAVGLAAAFLADAFFKQFNASRGEYYFLLLSSIFGLILIAASADFLTLFLGMETLSIALYILCGYMKQWELSHEAAVKYFFMGAISASFLIYGIALVYGAVGTTQFDTLLADYKKLDTSANNALFFSGIAFITLGLCFKAAVVPFHFWAPDVYDGASNPVTAFMAVGTKAGAFAALIRIFMIALPGFSLVWNEGIAILAYLTLIYANFLALRQLQLRRFFAYSGISHAGFLLLPLAAGTQDAVSAMIFYLIVYGFATLGCFGVLAYLDEKKEGVLLEDLKGLFYKSPYLACIFGVCLLTLAGIPPTVGFFAKLYVLKVTFEAGFHGLVLVALGTTILSAYYYLRFAAIMFRNPTTETFNRSWTAKTVATVAIVGLVLLTFFPALTLYQ